MDKEQKAFTDSGRQAAYLYNGAFEVFKNSEKAERIVFLFFFGFNIWQRENSINVIPYV